ncbi:hypothetical protein MNAN1_000238 [Malassezia nana]|uniref:Uncharacterized protein n=1 Tax=Malassezia nana TaxID=180528 RepID=A0AAF0EIH4_9BASI|nr:hypothetical protein MNAN1_000238 [Malassezia nana]
MPGCNEEAVRALFAEHGGDTLQAKDLIHVVESYEKQCGAPVVAAPIALQMSAFASHNGALPVSIDEFLGMVRSLEQEADSSMDTSMPSLVEQDEDSPDTTLEVGLESPMKHKSAYASHARAQLDRTAAQGSLTSAHSDSDVSGVSVRSRLIRKLARVSEQLERLQSEHDALTVDKAQGDADRSALQRQVKMLQQELRVVRDHAQQLEDQLHHREETLTALRHERSSQARTIQTLNARVGQFSQIQKEQEVDAAKHESELEQARASCRAYVLQVRELQETCQSQRQAMERLEASINALESVYVDADRLQEEVDASRQVRERLEWELQALRQQTGESISVLARDLDPLGEWTVTEAPEEVAAPCSLPSPAPSPAPKEAPTAQDDSPSLSAPSFTESHAGGPLDFPPPRRLCMQAGSYSHMGSC